MGLDMKDKKKVCREIARRYQQADKKGKGKLLDEYMATLGYNRDYLALIQSNWGKPGVSRQRANRLKLLPHPAGRPAQGPLGARKPKYRGKAAFTALLEDIWNLFDGMCGRTEGPQLLASMLRLMLDFLTAEYSLTPDMRALLASVSPRTIDRILKPVKDTGRLRVLEPDEGRHAPSGRASLPPSGC